MYGKRLLQNVLIFGFTASFTVLLLIGVYRVHQQNAVTAVEPKTSTPPPAPVSFPPTDQGSTPPIDAVSHTYTGQTFTIPWGDVTVAITVQNKKIIDVQIPDVPRSPPSEYAKDILIRQAIDAGSANIQGVSGATYMSLAFKRSLESAISQAGI